MNSVFGYPSSFTSKLHNLLLAHASIEVRCLPLNQSAVAGERLYDRRSYDIGHMIEAAQPGLWVADSVRKRCGRRKWVNWSL